MASIIQDQITQTAENISDLENSVVGGNSTEYMMSRTQHVGGSLNDLVPHRVDPVGKTTVSGVHIQRSGLTPDVNPTPHVEPVSTPSLLGDYNMLVANKYNLFVGSNGIKQETLGMYEITGGILSIKGRQVNISSDTEVLVDAKTLTFRGDNISLEPRERVKNGQRYKSVGISGNIGVDGNAIIAGGIHAEGGVTTHSITAPMEFQESEKTLNFNSQIAGKVIGKLDPVTNNVISVAVKDIGVSATTTISVGIPTRFVDSNDDLRGVATDCNQPEKVLAKPVDNEGNPRKRTVGNYQPFLKRFYNLDDDCRDQAQIFDKLIDDLTNGVITPDQARSLVTKASDSPISETSVNGDCVPCD